MKLEPGIVYGSVISSIRAVQNLLFTIYDRFWRLSFEPC